MCSNLFDPSDNFRPRSNSKRRRTDNSNYDLDDRFDLTRDFPPLTVPDKPCIDLESIAELMIEASADVPTMKSILEKPELNSDDTKKAVSFSLKVFGMLEGMWERAVRPMADGNAVGRAAAVRAPAPVEQPDADLAELREVLQKADRTAVLYDANLGTVPVANRQKLCHALSAGIRESAIGIAMGDGGDPSEAVEVANDALSLVTDMAFLGQVSRPAKDMQQKEKGYCTLPVKLEFDDRGARIHFEQTIKARCGIRATMSLPKVIRDMQKKFHAELKSAYNDEIVMIRVDVEKLCLLAFHKKDKGPKWLPCPESRPMSRLMLILEFVDIIITGVCVIRFYSLI